MDDEKTQKLETLIAHQERQIQDLSDMLLTQGRDMARLARRLEKLEGRLDSVENPGAPGQEKPPHY